MTAILKAIAAGVLFLLLALPASASEAVILMYRRFGEEGAPLSNIRLDQFEAQLQELKSGGYTVLPLPDIVAAFKNGKELPERTVAITLEGAFASVYAEAWPRLKAAGLPFTLFVGTAALDRGNAGSMTWDQVRELQSADVAIGHHGHDRESYLGISEQAVTADIARASARLKAELGVTPTLFAYPSGVYDLKIRDLAAGQGFIAAVAQYSSVAASAGSIFELPRFALSETYASPGRFRMIVNARALPVAEVVPADPRLTANPPAFGFSLTREVPGLSALACYPSHLDQPAEITLLGQSRVEVRFEKPFPKGRSRINCTLPGPRGRWYWFGRPFFVD